MISAAARLFSRQSAGQTLSWSLSPKNPTKPIQQMKKTALFVVAAVVISVVSVGCSASGRISVPNGSITKPSQAAQVAYVTKPAPDQR
jgi:hypothetical protein